MRPKVLLMDEPCSALDPISTSVIEETIRELCHELTIVIVTHNMQQAQRVSDTCALFLVDGEGQPGHIVEAGPTATGVRRPTRSPDLRLRPRAVRMIRPTWRSSVRTAHPLEEATVTEAMSVPRRAPRRAAVAALADRLAARGGRMPRRRPAPGCRSASCSVSVLVAYNYSLSTLLQTADQQTPLAYISLVPAIALALAAIRARPLKPEPPIYDRHVDYTIGIPLIVAAVAVNELLPARMSAMFWVYRIDLLTLPDLRGRRRGHHLRGPGALAPAAGRPLPVPGLALPLPEDACSASQRLHHGHPAGHAEDRRVTHLAKPAELPGQHAVRRQSPWVDVRPQRRLGVLGGERRGRVPAGGSAFAAIVRGPIVRKVLWLVGGMVLLWAINLGRITFIFFAGKEWGEAVAINVFHPFIGLVTFSIGVLIMILLIKPLGMHIAIGEDSRPSRAAGATGPSRCPRCSTKPRQRPSTRLTLAVPKVYLAIVAVVVAALVVGLSNLGLRSYNLVADVAGEAKLARLRPVSRGPTGLGGPVRDHLRLGQAAVRRHVRVEPLHPPRRRAGPLHTNVPVVADVINTPDLSSFSAYGVENCYTFHGYALADVAQVSLVGGITGQAMSYTSQQFGSWSIVYWILPVKMTAGARTTSGSCSTCRTPGRVLWLRA